MIAQTLFLATAGAFGGAVGAAMLAAICDLEPGEFLANTFIFLGIALGSTGLVWAYG